MENDWNENVSPKIDNFDSIDLVYLVADKESIAHGVLDNAQTIHLVHKTVYGKIHILDGL